MKPTVGISLLLSLWMISCSNQLNEQAPDELLSKSKIAQVQLQLELIQGVLRYDKLEKDSLVLVFARERNKVFEELGVDSAAFYASYDYYLSRPELFLKVYLEINDSLDAMSERLKAPKVPKDTNKQPAEDE